MGGHPGGFAFTLEDGRAAVGGARAVVEAAVRGDAAAPRLSWPAAFAKPGGAFTTLSTHPSGELRGCIGFAEPVLPLKDAIASSALAAAREDGRFAPVEPAELPRLIVEVSLLTAPRRLEAVGEAAKVAAVEVGRHGLIVRAGRRTGLLLPQVAPEWGWSAREFLEHTCIKGGFEPDYWKQSGAALFTFEAEVFAEIEPRGVAERREH